tara:strand:+ start:205 stop:981 length:777 start_codon:yes stop_codon:yes gene_type:complete
MGSWKTQIFLTKLSKLSHQQKRSFSKQEIIKKMNEIKYLSAQKKVPKLTLRKEILHLETKLEGIFQLENKLLKSKKHESVKVTSLKRQITHLKKKLSTCEDKNLHQKVDKLSHLLGDNLARTETKKDAKAVARSVKRRKNLQEKNIELFKTLSKRLSALKHELNILRQIEEKNPVKVAELQQKVYLLTQKLKEYQEKHPECMVQEIEIELPPIEEVQHQFLVHESIAKSNQFQVVDSNKVDQELEQELPLPPPPKIKA